MHTHINLNVTRFFFLFILIWTVMRQQWEVTARLLYLCGMLYVTRQKDFKVSVSSSSSPMNTKECVARRKYKTQVFLWKKNTQKRKHQPPWTVLHFCQRMKLFLFSWKRLTFDWAKFETGLLPEHCLPASYLIAQSIWNHSKNTRAQQAVRKRRISHRVSRAALYRVKGQSAWWCDAEGRITCTLLYHHPFPKTHIHSLYPGSVCHQGKTAAAIYDHRATQPALFSCQKKKIWLKGGNGT